MMVLLIDFLVISFFMHFIATLLDINSHTYLALKKRWAAEREVRICGEIAALQKNIAIASKYLVGRHPKAKAQIKAGAEDYLNQARLLIPPQVNAQNCQHFNYKNLAATPYPQENPDLPRNWPNYFYRFSFTKL